MASVDWKAVGLGVLAAIFVAWQVASYLRARGAWKADPQVWSIVQTIMNIVKELGEKVTPGEVAAVAGDVYDRVIENSFLGKLATRDQFVEFVVEQWRRLTDVEVVGKSAARSISMRRLK